MKLSTKLLTFCLATVGITTLIFIISGYVAARQEIVKQEGVKAAAIAGVLSVAIDGEEHELIQEPEQATSEAFLKIRNFLRTAEKADHLKSPLYTFRRVGNALKFVVMTHEKPFIGDSYDYKKYQLETYVNQVFETGLPIATGFYKSTSNSYVTGYGPIRNAANEVVALVAVDIPLESLQSELFNRTLTLLIEGVVAGLLASLLALFMIRGHSRELVNWVNYIRQIAESKDLTGRVNQSSTHELGLLAQSFNGFAHEVQQLVLRLRVSMQGLDKETGVMNEQNQELAQIAKRTSDRLNQVAKVSREAADKVHRITHSSQNSQEMIEGVVRNNEKILLNLQDVSKTADAMSQLVEEVASSIEGLTQTIHSIGDTITQARQVAKEASHATTQTNHLVNTLGTAATEIGDVVAVITAIAAKTNLLALNASIEAARAGDAGRGFAVVANEVKDLAHQTASATDDIQKKVKAIQANSQNAIAAIRDITVIIEKINQQTATIADAVAQQTETAHRIETRTIEASHRAGEVSKNVASSAQLAKGVRDDARATLEAAKGISAEALQVDRSTKMTLDESVSVAQMASDTERAVMSLDQVSARLAVLSGELMAQIGSFKA